MESTYVFTNYIQGPDSTTILELTFTFKDRGPKANKLTSRLSQLGL